MFHRAFVSILVTSAALFALAAAEGCGATPDTESAAAAASSEGLSTATCLEPFVTIGYQCTPLLHGQWCGLVCDVPVTARPEPDDAGGDWAEVVTATLAAPAALGARATLGESLSGTGFAVSKFWAIPAEADGGIPSVPAQLGTLPVCAPDAGLAHGEACEVVSVSRNITPNPILGPAEPGWVLVEEFDTYWQSYDVGGGCSSACARLTP